MKMRTSDYPFHPMEESENPRTRISRANLETIRRAVEADDKRRRAKELELNSHRAKRGAQGWFGHSLIWRFLRRFLP